MKVIVGSGRRGPIASIALILGSCTLAGFSALSSLPTAKVAPGIALAGLLMVAHKRLLVWRRLISFLLVIILFIPIKRYTMPGNLPFQLEPYRLVVALLATGWVASLLVDPRVRPRKTGFEGVFFFLAASVLGSIIANGARITSLGVSSDVVKKLTFFLSFILVIYIVVSLAPRMGDITLLLQVLVTGGGILGVLALVEARTKYNIFDHLSSFVPLLKFTDTSLNAQNLNRGGHFRVYASAQHPIAMGAAFVMLLPLAVYLHRRTRQSRWLFALALIMLGALSSVSRTSIVMLAVVALTFLRLRPVETKRLWPLLIPGLLLIHLAVPGTIGNIKQSFFPSGGLVAQQTKGGVGSGRVATLGPALHDEFAPHPLLGEGFGTRVTTSDSGSAAVNSPILDDQWLGTLCETGVLGVAAWLLLFFTVVRRLGRAAKEDATSRGWLFAALAAGISSFGTGMFFFDAFSFIQVTFLLFVLLALGAAALNARPEPGVA